MAHISKYKENFISHFSNTAVIKTEDIFSFFRTEEPNIAVSTVKKRIKTLSLNGIIHSIEKGKYSFEKKQDFTLTLDYKMKRVRTFINRNYPLVDYCIWDLSFMNKILHHLINFNVYIVDVEKDAEESIYYALKDNFTKITTAKNINNNLVDYKDYFIVRKLVSRSPISRKKIRVASFEKILVDLATDKVFSVFQGYEILHIFDNAFSLYSINKKTLISYAKRKKKLQEIEQILKSIITPII
jgi:hypothetical protein